jgi:hypothetical protein
MLGKAMRARRTRWLFVALVILLLAALLASRTKKLTDSVWTVELFGGCAIDYHTSPKALALACPGADYTRLWPLPVTRPWEELGGAIWGQLAREESIGTRYSMSSINTGVDNYARWP